MSTEIIAKLNKLENVQIGMQAELKVFAKTMERLAKTSEQTVALRSECLHMIKVHERSERAHDELFERLPELETWKGGMESKMKSVCRSMQTLQGHHWNRIFFFELSQTVSITDIEDRWKFCSRPDGRQK